MPGPPTCSPRPALLQLWSEFVRTVLADPEMADNIMVKVTVLQGSHTDANKPSRTLNEEESKGPFG